VRGGRSVRAILLESASISALGMMAGFLVYAAIGAGRGRRSCRPQTGVVIDPFKFSRHYVVGADGVDALGALAGVVPAIKAYRPRWAETWRPLS